MLPSLLVLMLGLTVGEIEAGVVGPQCCAHPGTSHLVCGPKSLQMTGVVTCSCVSRLVGNGSLDISEARELSLINVTTNNLVPCLNAIFESGNNGNAVSGLVIEGSRFQRNVTSNAAHFPATGNRQAEVNKLKIKNTGFSHINSKLFDLFSSIWELYLPFNGIKEISADIFDSDSMFGLGYLDVSHNQILLLDACVFQNLPNLRSLNLSHNLISIINPGTFSPLGSLDELDLSFNQLKSVQSSTFAGLTFLNTLNLQSNQIFEVNFTLPYSCNEAGSCNATYCSEPNVLAHLETLDLSDNVITDVSNATMFSMMKTHLLTLRLNMNRITTVGFESFRNMCALQTLDLSRNRIGSIRADFGSSCNENPKSQPVGYGGQMMLFNLSDNKLTQLPSAAFRSIPDITNLDLSRNSLEGVVEDAFVGLNSIRVISLRGNRLKSVPTAILRDLHLLDLRNNLLSKISPYWVESLAPSRGGQLLVAGNSLVCDETMAELLQNATCNQIPEHEQYSNEAVVALESLNATLSSGRPVNLPEPGLCIRSGRDGTSCVKYGAEMNVCVLQAYMTMLRKGVLPGNQEVLVRILSQIQSLYHYARNAEEGSNAKRLQGVKHFIVEALGVISEQIPLPSSWMLGYVSQDITMGASDVSKSSNDVIAFSLHENGEVSFGSAKTGLSAVGGDVPTIKACNVNTSTSRSIEIKLPASSFEKEGTRNRVTFATYKNAFLFPSGEVLSSIISASVAGINVTNSVDPIEIVATLNRSHSENVTCAFWDKKTSSWSTEGCRRVNFTEVENGYGLARVTCHCTHLTNFGIILDYNPTGKMPLASSVKSNLSFVGIMASIVGLAITIVYRLSVRDLRRGVPQIILLHLCFCLLIVYIFLLSADNEALMSKPVGCFFVALILHMSLLSVWGWNVVEAVSMHLLLVKVYNVNMRHFLTKATVACYGTSVIFVVTNLILAYTTTTDKAHFFSNFTSPVACVISPKSSPYTLLLPISVAFLLNCFLFVKIIHALRTPSKSASRSESRKLKNRLRQAVCVTALLGITWAIGFIKVAVQLSSGSNDTSYAVWILDLLFTVVNSIQGFVIFLMFCLQRILMESHCWSKWERMRSDSSISSPRWISGTDFQTGRRSTNF